MELLKILQRKNLVGKELFSSEKKKDKSHPPFLNCQQTEDLLETYWKTPEEFSQSKRFSIALHLLKCKKCAEKFVEIKEKNPL